MDQIGGILVFETPPRFPCFLAAESLFSCASPSSLTSTAHLALPPTWITLKSSNVGYPHKMAKKSFISSMSPILLFLVFISVELALRSCLALGTRMIFVAVLCWVTHRARYLRLPSFVKNVFRLLFVVSSSRVEVLTIITHRRPEKAGSLSVAFSCPYPRSRIQFDPSNSGRRRRRRRRRHMSSVRERVHLSSQTRRLRRSDQRYSSFHSLYLYVRWLSSRASLTSIFKDKDYCTAKAQGPVYTQCQRGTCCAVAITAHPIFRSVCCQSITHRARIVPCCPASQTSRSTSEGCCCCSRGCESSCISKQQWIRNRPQEQTSCRQQEIITEDVVYPLKFYRIGQLCSRPNTRHIERRRRRRHSVGNLSYIYVSGL